MRTFLARECGDALSSSSQPLQELQRVMKERFAESEFLAGVPEKLGGAICMQVMKTIQILLVNGLIFYDYSMIKNQARESFSGPTPLPLWVLASR